MTIDNAELKALAEAMPELDWDSEFENQEQTGFCTVFVKPFEIDGELHDGPTLIDRCTAEQAEFVAGAKTTVLGLLAENEALQGLYRMHKETETRAMRDLKVERDQLRVENLRLHRDLGRAGRNLHEAVEPLRRDAERYRWLRRQIENCEWMAGISTITDKFGAVSEERVCGAEDLDHTIDTSMSKEASHD